MFVAASSALVARADWPSDPGSPLALGAIEGITSTKHAAVTAPDGATWVGWIDNQCFGSLRLQRIAADGSLTAPGGVELDSDGGCVSTTVVLAACTDGSAIISRESGPVRRIAADGTSMWGPGGGGIPIGSGVMSAAMALPDDSALIAWRAGATIVLSRLTASGEPVWAQPTVISSSAGSNFRIFALVSDGADGAFIFWDSPATYTRVIRGVRVAADGQPAWPGSIIITPMPPFASRHSNPVAVPVNDGGAVVVWVGGAETAETAVPLRWQHIDASGAMLLAAEGERVSLSTARQFDPVVVHDHSTDDLLVGWRDGVINPQSLRAQRLTLSGERLWGTNGVFVAPLTNLNRFDGCAGSAPEVSMALVAGATTSDPDGSSVNVFRLDADGLVAAEPWPLSDPTAAGALHALTVGTALVVSWIRDDPGPGDNSLVAQRVNADGSLGAPPGVIGDLNGDGTVDGADLAVVLGGWGACGGGACPADVNGDGEVDGSDLAILLGHWS